MTWREARVVRSGATVTLARGNRGVGSWGSSRLPSSTPPEGTPLHGARRGLQATSRDDRWTPCAPQPRRRRGAPEAPQQPPRRPAALDHRVDTQGAVAVGRGQRVRSQHPEQEFCPGNPGWVEAPASLGSGREQREPGSRLDLGSGDDVGASVGRGGEDAVVVGGVSSGLRQDGDESREQLVRREHDAGSRARTSGTGFRRPAGCACRATAGGAGRSDTGVPAPRGRGARCGPRRAGGSTRRPRSGRGGGERGAGASTAGRRRHAGPAPRVRRPRRRGAGAGRPRRRRRPPHRPRRRPARAREAAPPRVRGPGPPRAAPRRWSARALRGTRRRPPRRPRRAPARGSAGSRSATSRRPARTSRFG
jgi:hypothetical protein